MEFHHLNDNEYWVRCVSAENILRWMTHLLLLFGWMPNRGLIMMAKVNQNIPTIFANVPWRNQCNSMTTNLALSTRSKSKYIRMERIREDWFAAYYNVTKSVTPCLSVLHSFIYYYFFFVLVILHMNMCARCLLTSTTQKKKKKC